MFGSWGLGLRIRGLQFGILGFEVLGFRVCGLGFGGCQERV